MRKFTEEELKEGVRILGRAVLHNGQSDHELSIVAMANLTIIRLMYSCVTDIRQTDDNVNGDTVVGLLNDNAKLVADMGSIIKENL